MSVVLSDPWVWPSMVALRHRIIVGTAWSVRVCLRGTSEGRCWCVPCLVGLAWKHGSETIGSQGRPLAPLLYDIARDRGAYVPQMAQQVALRASCLIALPPTRLQGRLFCEDSIGAMMPSGQVACIKQGVLVWRTWA